MPDLPPSHPPAAIYLGKGTRAIIKENTFDGFDQAIIAEDVQEMSIVGNRIYAPDKTTLPPALVQAAAAELKRSLEGNLRAADNIDKEDFAKKTGIWDWAKEHGADAVNATATVIALLLKR